MERPRGRIGTGLDVASTSVTALNVGAGLASTAATVRDVRKVAGKVVSKGRRGGGRAVSAAARAADSRVGSTMAAVLNRTAANPAFQIAAKASIPLLAFRAGVNMTKGYAADGVRGAVRGAIGTLDPTALATMFMQDQRGLAERAFDRMFGRALPLAAPGAGAYLDKAAETRTTGNEMRAAAEQSARPRMAAAPDKGGGAYEVKAYTRSDGTPVAGYSMPGRKPGS